MAVHVHGRGPGHLCRVTNAAVSPLAAYALALDFKNGAYWKAGVQQASLSAMAGYSYSRSGQVSFVNSGGTVTDFAANVPPILASIGYEAYGALTNTLLQSQAFENASWGQNATTPTANTTVAPDGTTTADTISDGTTTAAHFVSQSYNPGATGTFTLSVFAKAGVGTGRYFQINDNHPSAASFCNFDLVAGTVGTSNLLTGSIIACGNGWYRCVVVGNIPSAIAGFMDFAMVQSASSARVPSYLGANNTVFLWQAQSLMGNFTDGGPIIATTTATATIGAEALSVSVPNATYSAVYTFSDNSTQTISTTISGGAFAMPAYAATLNKPAVSLVTLT